MAVCRTGDQSVAMVCAPSRSVIGSVRHTATTPDAAGKPTDREDHELQLEY